MSAESASDNFRDWLEAMHPRLSRFEDYLLPKHIVHADGTREERNTIALVVVAGTIRTSRVSSFQVARI